MVSAITAATRGTNVKVTVQPDGDALLEITLDLGDCVICLVRWSRKKVKIIVLCVSSSVVAQIIVNLLNK